MNEARCFYICVDEHGTPYLSDDSARMLDIREGDTIGIWNAGNWFYCVNPRKDKDAAITLTLADVNKMALECIKLRAFDYQDFEFENE